MEKNKEAKRAAMIIILLSWYLVAMVFIGNYIRVNYVQPDYITAYWIAVTIWSSGTYIAIAYYCIHKH